MKIKYFLAGLLCVCLVTSMMTACANPQNAQSSETQEVKTEKLHKLYIRAPKEFTELTVMFSCTGSGKTADVKMTKSGEDDTCAIFSCEADVNLYNLVRVKNGEKEGFDVAFNSFVSGWNFEDMKNPLPYVAGTKPSYDPKLETKEFKFDGRDKKVYIWTPEDYDEKSDDKYSVIYMFDGQSILAKGVDKGMDNDVVCWNVSESVTSMMSVTDNKAIIVGITNNDVYRNDELIPDLGDINTEAGDPNMDPEGIRTWTRTSSPINAEAPLLIFYAIPLCLMLRKTTTSTPTLSIPLWRVPRWADSRPSIRFWRIPISSAPAA